MRTEFHQKKASEVLNEIAQELWQRYGARVFFAEILGKRWSYQAGVGHEFPTPLLQRITITPRFGLVAEGWEKIPEEDRAVLFSFLKTYLTQERSGTLKSSS